jgi:predicted O-methyltransferase YrrM
MFKSPRKLIRRLLMGFSTAEKAMTEPTLIELPKTPYARYAVPIEYEPSRDYKGRWGRSDHPPLQWLMRQFGRHRLAYKARLELMSEVSGLMKSIPEQFDAANLPTPAWYGAPYAPFDAVALCTMIKTHKPKVFLEIGSGISTCFARFAINAFGLDTKIISIDPEPRAEVDNICDQVIRDSLENCDMAIFDQLEPNDILFFDGSHRSFQNSDVTVFFGDVLPRIKVGTVIHIHDISIPYDYPDWALNWYWNEQFLLMSLFLGAGSKIDPLLPTSYICHDDELMASFVPQVELQELAGWRGGGAMWFTLNETLG